MMNRKLSPFLARGAAIVLALSAAAAGALLPAGVAQAREMKIATIAASNSPWDHAMRAFADEAGKQSGNDLQVHVYTDGQLGDISKILSSMQLGTLDMGYFGLGSVVLLRGAQPLNILYAPYLFKSGEQAERIINSDEFAKIFDDVAKKSGVRVFAAFGIRSPRALQTVSRAINKPEDVKGLKLRVPSIPILKSTFEKLGAQVVPLGMTEIYTALGRGMIDGQDNGFDLSIPLRFHEEAKFWAATDHAYELTGWFISERVWQSLNDKQRQALIDAARAGGQVATRLDKELDDNAVKLLKDAGVTYTQPDKAAFKAALATVYQQYEGKDWPAGMVERIQKMQE
ncbi:TRAP transporter substrate-binding protein [Achromobacter denitrificans]|uniref:TRAP transporter substrate-binding protein n=2 Tax=Achromobacter TaxID=222 RepID=A0A6N0JHH7_ACHDE|nr:TRAP transporter substrate-binding protein [Achromobacter denitrificans]QKQ46270.1 TRAP transporter substrate-binding protein [Achromobacter denitrificans]